MLYELNAKVLLVNKRLLIGYDFVISKYVVVTGWEEPLQIIGLIRFSILSIKFGLNILKFIFYIILSLWKVEKAICTNNSIGELER